MKKIIALVLMILTVFFVFAEEGPTAPPSDSVSVYLTAPDNIVKIGFANSVDNAKKGIPVSVDFNLGKFSLTDDLKLAEKTYSDTIFIFYRGIVNSSASYNLSLTIKSPFKYWDGSAYSGAETDIINFTATVKNPTSETKWDGSNATNIGSGISVPTTNSATALETQFRKTGATNFIVNGIAQIEIVISDTDVSSLKYGKYRTEMTLTLTTT